MSDFEFPGRSNVVTVTVDDYSDDVDDLSGEWEALSSSYSAMPEYFPKPDGAEWDDEGNVVEYDIVVPSDLGSMSSIEGEPAVLQENIYRELEDVVSELHSNPNLSPHGRLLNNTMRNYGSPFIMGPRGRPVTEQEELEWIENDLIALEYFSDELTPDGDYLLAHE